MATADSPRSGIRIPPMAQEHSPRFNHVALSLPADALGADGRAEITDFYGDVFGWTEIDMLTEDRKRLVLHGATVDQFVFLVGSDQPMSAPRMDHFGLAVATREEFDTLLEKVKARAATDRRVDVIDHSVDDYEVLKLHSFYVRHLLPMMVEVQWWEWTEAA